MACYCGREVRYRGRLIEIIFRYGCFMTAKVKKGKSLPVLGRGWDYGDQRKVATDATRGILRILRRQNEVNQRGGLTACSSCQV